MHDPTSVQKKLAQPLYLEKEAIPDYSVLIGHGHLQHGGCGWQGSHSLRYHTCLNSWTYEQKDAVAFSYGASVPAVKQPVQGPEKIMTRKRVLAEPAGPIRMTVPRIMTSSEKEGDRMKVPMQLAQTLLKFRIGKLPLLAYHRTRT